MDNYSTCLSYNKYKNKLCIDGVEVSADEFVFYAARIANECIQKEGPIPMPIEQPERKVNSRKSGLNYLMYDEASGYYKIGFTRKDPLIREATLGAQMPKIKLVKAWPGTTATERSLHERFAEKRVRGEWFDLSEEDLMLFGKY